MKLLPSETVCAFPTSQGVKPELEPCKGWILLLTFTAEEYISLNNGAKSPNYICCKAGAGGNSLAARWLSTATSGRF